MSISTLSKEKVTIKQAISDFFLSCKVEGKSSETAVCQGLKIANVQLWCQNRQEMGGTGLEPVTPCV